MKIRSEVNPTLLIECFDDGRTEHSTIILDSINGYTGSRLTTFKTKLWKLLVGEFNTHRMLSRCSASSRAVSEKKLRDRVLNNPFLPFFWGKDQKGMQAREELSQDKIEACKEIIMDLLLNAVEAHKKLSDIGLHKQIANRYIEPWMETEIIWSATATDNLRKLRIHKDAQPEFALPIEESFYLLDRSKPKVLKHGEWHIPFILEQEKELNIKDQLMISAARCARASYYLPDGQLSSTEKDLELYQKLAGSDPKHLSPLEHQAVCIHASELPGIFNQHEITSMHGNFRGGWIQHRGIVELDFGINNLYSLFKREGD